MYANMMQVSVQDGKLDEAIGLIRDSVLPAARDQKGFTRGFVMADEESNRIVTFSFWETREDLVAMAENGFLKEQTLKVAPLFTAPPERGALRVVHADV